MNRFSTTLFMLLIAGFLASCTTPNYFHDDSSRKRQQELLDKRSSHVTRDVFVCLASVFLSTALDDYNHDVDVNVLYVPQGQQFKYLNLYNSTRDTMYVNMLTDVYWDTNNYCDFMDIRIPAHRKCKVMVPMDANYNLYFSNTPQSDDDKLLQIYTTRERNISLGSRR